MTTQVIRVIVMVDVVGIEKSSASVDERLLWGSKIYNMFLLLTYSFWCSVMTLLLPSALLMADVCLITLLSGRVFCTRFLFWWNQKMTNNGSV